MKFVPQEPRIEVAADWQIANRVFYLENIWVPARNIHPVIGSYSNWLRVLDMIDALEGKFFFPDKRKWTHDEVPDIFTEDGAKWIANFLAPDKSGERPRSYSQKYERLRCVEVYCRILRDMRAD